MADILDEIKDDLKRERFENVLKKYGSFLVFFIILILFAVAGVSFYESLQKKRNLELANQYIPIYDKINSLSFQVRPNLGEREEVEIRDMEEALNKIVKQNKKSEYTNLAILSLANLKERQNQHDEAISLYQKILENKYTDKAIKELAELKKTIIFIESDFSEKEQEIEKSLDLLTQEQSVWRSTAQELKAIYFLKKGDVKKCKEILTNIINDPLAPKSLKRRAQKIIKK